MSFLFHNSYHKEFWPFPNFLIFYYFISKVKYGIIHFQLLNYGLYNTAFGNYCSAEKSCLTSLLHKYLSCQQSTRFYIKILCLKIDIKRIEKQLNKKKSNKTNISVNSNIHSSEPIY